MNEHENFIGFNIKPNLDENKNNSQDDFNGFKLEGSNKSIESYNSKESIKKTIKNYINYTDDEVVSVGKWILLYLALVFIGVIPYIGPIIVLFLLFYMALSSDINLNLRNWARANLILIVISIVLIFLIGPVLLSIYKALINT